MDSSPIPLIVILEQEILSLMIAILVPLQHYSLMMKMIILLTFNLT